MCAAVIGGMDRLKRDYINAAKREGVKLKVFTGKENRIAPKLGSASLIILFTNQLSHAARRDVINHAKKNNIPVEQAHSCGVSSLRECLNRS
ncbi:DUF2325 domain-containing protein [Desulfovibrio ferrophilus]|uniref:DUF2325 domain-containing protein n=1 Tax=Desulfovibrio ferrophilus TaxID=241368 RepID=A0A2Z6AU85_9BACT|nr:DUF2325 domain-containing protein [Desulfovibrio ferrophilus]BBD06746.1 hypothetical protein DFE_0020 [Desulfovibrio ferrophilus]